MEDQLYPSSIWDNPFYQSTSHFQVAVALLFAPTPSVRQTASELVGRQHATGKIRRHGIPGSNGHRLFQHHLLNNPTQQLFFH
ncbi:uncharacterized protein LOC112130931 isoform X2 [Pongo abelii]|uniref:uncharacterized protein LOC112130931 isoform X2 n=1 Tax=Pongo abelii TaxID=9601 RepID=UPI0023E84E97|nr:uncharacterized protein LOC112130931 isoform X2 [Pongo abelii]